ncbi:MAG: tRNA (adenosine(37)-N6)-threonylcarbamoyltransferase complex ATPase subunit type 1 TsaE [Patescibacteria group bacterium]|nr:tRNA (adenosine(37)-N6)-threonylcarbamoyltransferase complex ATPase subunit type 1 TsaE [Patescibacteria group bacterium]
MEIITQNPRETQGLGQKIGTDLKSGRLKKGILCLFGDLGSGKTTFVQGLAKGLGIKKRITSPTFVFIKKYQPNFYHVDLYRIEKLKETKGLDLEEIFSDPQAIVAVEWAEKIKEILPKQRIDIRFNYLDNKKRKIIISY